MYTKFFKLDRPPFPNIPDPGVLYLSKSHQRALSILKYAAMSRAGFCVVTGEAGTGKTTLVRRLLQEIDVDLDVGVVTMTQFESFEELLKWILLAYNQDFTSSDKVVLFNQLSQYLITRYEEGHPATLIIDEAQHLGPPQLEQLRMLSNLNTEKGLLLQTILVGQPELWDNLKRHELRQFAQRISYDTHIMPLESEEIVGEYIRHRLELAGGATDLFDRDTYAYIWIATHGIPRLVNLVCDTALVYAFAEQMERVDTFLLQDVLNDKNASLAPITRLEAEGANGPIDPAPNGSQDPREQAPALGEDEYPLDEAVGAETLEAGRAMNFDEDRRRIEARFRNARRRFKSDRA